MKTTQKVLVTGAGGFIGSHLTQRLMQRGYAVTAFVHYNSKNSWGWLETQRSRVGMKVIAGDIRDGDMVRYAMRKVDKVFHLAALIGIPYSYYSPEAYMETNIKGTLNVLQAAKDFGVKKVIITSTSEIYGTAQFVPITESHPVNPQSPYAASKAGADHLAMSFYRSFDLPVTIVRPFNTYGPRQSARAVIPTIISQIIQGDKKIRLGSLGPTRDFTYVEDTVSGFISAGECAKAQGEIINLGSHSEISIGDLARMISKLLGEKITIESQKDRLRPPKSEVERLLADTTKAGKLLGWKPKYSLEDGLKKTIEWIKENFKVYKSSLYNI